MPQTMTPQQFADKWRHNTQKESSFDREHFNDLCALLGHPTPNEFDPTGKIFGFQSDLKKAGGGQGFADVWYKDHFAWEYKGPDGDFKAAFEQLLQYHDALGNPPLLVVSNAQKMVIRTKFTNTSTQEYTLTLDDLLKPAGDPAVEAIAQAARELVRYRDNWLNPPDAGPEELKNAP